MRFPVGALASMVVAAVLGLQIDLMAQRQSPIDRTATAEARKNVAAAQQEVAKAQQQLNAVKEKLLPAFEATEPWREASQRHKQAQAAYQAASAPVLQEVRSSDAYQNAAADRAAAQKELEAIKNDPKAPAEAFNKATERLLTATNVMTQLEEQALGTNPQVVVTKTELDDAEQQLQQLRQQFEQQVQSDPQWQEAQEALDQAEEQLTTARAALAEASKQQRQQRQQRPARQPTPRRQPREQY